jgi:hypothetical protein
MANKILTEEEILDAVYDSDTSEHNNSACNDDESSDDSSDSEIDFVEENSEKEDEQLLSENDNDDDMNVIEKFIGKDGTVWDSLPNPELRTPARNIIRGATHKVILPAGKKIDSTDDAFSLMFNDSVIDTIVKYTNIRATGIIGISWKTIDRIELQAFFGLLITVGINKQGIINYNEFWCPLFGSQIFRACMSRNRFTAILRFIRFDDKSTRSSRRSKDKLAPIRDIWDMITKNLLKHYLPGDNLTIDEQLVPFRGRVSFRQYIPNKPDKYGIKIWWICDSKTSYPLYGIPYLGKEGPMRAVNLAWKVVEELCEPFVRTNRNITFDNYFTSYDLANSLLSKGLTIVGTLRKNKTFIPSNFLPNTRREPFSNVFGFRKNMTLVSYVPKKNRAVLLLSTMHQSNHTDPSNSNKSEINLYYNSTKGGVDTLDQMAHAYSVKRKTNRWPLLFLYNLIDVCGIAAFVVYMNLYPDWNKNKPRLRRKLFLKDIAMNMVQAQIKRRSNKGLSRRLVATISDVMRNSENTQNTHPVKHTKSRKRCHMCPSKISRFSPQCCSSCGLNICKEHSEKRVICKMCNKNNHFVIS